jgi:translation elongation factor EF-1beta
MAVTPASAEETDMKELERQIRQVRPLSAGGTLRWDSFEMRELCYGVKYWRVCGWVNEQTATEDLIEQIEDDPLVGSVRVIGCELDL